LFPSKFHCPNWDNVNVERDESFQREVKEDGGKHCKIINILILYNVRREKGVGGETLSDWTGCCLGSTLTPRD
jgi:hypothetical protein